MKSVSITIKNWSAWMPGIQSSQQWQQWAQGKQHISLDAPFPVPNIHAMLRRRLSTLGKMALNVATELTPSNAKMPYLFCSRHGDLGRTVHLLDTLSKQESLSPTHFSLSVHNAVGGIMSIARKDSSNITALAVVNDDITTALLEAVAIMEERNHPQIACIIYDEPVPNTYKDLTIQPQHPYAIALLLSQETSPPHKERLSFSICQPENKKHSTNEPQALTLLRFILSADSPDLLLSCEQHAWHWSKLKGSSPQ